MQIALFTYSTKPRGGVVHTLALAEQLQTLGNEVHVFSLGKEGQRGFFRPTTVPFTLIPVETRPVEVEPLDERIKRYIQSYYDFLTRHRLTQFDLYHAQDCISANALWRLREEGLIPSFVRTIHHTDDFVSPTLIDCQNHSIYRPNQLIVVSRYWQERLANEFQVNSQVIYNGVDLARFQPGSATARSEARATLGLPDDQLIFLSVGGVEPRKNSIRLLLAFQRIYPRLAAQGMKPVLLIVGGDTLFDYTAYRDEFFEVLAQSGLVMGQDVLLPGPAPDEHMPLLYHAADALVFPSVKEGWGLVVLEAMASGLAVLTSDLPVFREYLQPEADALLIDPTAEDSLAAGLLRLAEDQALRRRLAVAGPALARRYSWTATATAHLAFYREMLGATRLKNYSTLGEKVSS